MSDFDFSLFSLFSAIIHVTLAYTYEGKEFTEELEVNCGNMTKAEIAGIRAQNEQQAHADAQADEQAKIDKAEADAQRVSEFDLIRCCRNHSTICSIH